MYQENDFYTHCNEIINAFNEVSWNGHGLVFFMDHLKRLVEIEATNDEKLYAVHAVINSSFYVNQSVFKLNAAAARLAHFLGTTEPIVLTQFQ